ncbi:MAG TPA: S-layer homology domain-containing protein, partial [Bacillota bacterium]|nr:S-layer homology domain-containing protein [Bacillota bacterium]
YYDAVMWAFENGFTAGISASSFGPDEKCTRAQVITFLWKALGSPAPESGNMPFGDVAAGSYYYGAVLWAFENGITAGTSASNFSPDSECTRAQTVTFLYKALGK